MNTFRITKLIDGSYCLSLREDDGRELDRQVQPTLKAFFITFDDVVEQWKGRYGLTRYSFDFHCKVARSAHQRKQWYDENVAFHVGDAVRFDTGVGIVVGVLHSDDFSVIRTGTKETIGYLEPLPLLRILPAGVESVYHYVIRPASYNVTRICKSELSKYTWPKVQPWHRLSDEIKEKYSKSVELIEKLVRYEVGDVISVGDNVGLIRNFIVYEDINPTSSISFPDSAIYNGHKVDVEVVLPSSKDAPLTLTTALENVQHTTTDGKFLFSIPLLERDQHTIAALFNGALLKHRETQVRKALGNK